MPVELGQASRRGQALQVAIFGKLGKVYLLHGRAILTHPREYTGYGGTHKSRRRIPLHVAFLFTLNGRDYAATAFEFRPVPDCPFSDTRTMAQELAPFDAEWLAVLGSIVEHRSLEADNGRPSK